MTSEMIKLIVESPNGVEMFNSWMFYKWASLIGGGIFFGIIIGFILWMIYREIGIGIDP